MAVPMKLAVATRAGEFAGGVVAGVSVQAVEVMRLSPGGRRHGRRPWYWRVD